MFIRIFYIVAILTICYSQNFSYSEDDWFIITSPDEITSISNAYDEILFSSTNGIFAYDKLSNDFYYKHYLISDYINDDMMLVHYDRFRDHIWILTNKALLFKSSISSIWREINFYDIGLHSFNNIYNIGSNQDYIILETNIEYLFIDPYNGNVVLESEAFSSLDFDQINWSSSYRSYINNNADLSSFFSLDDWNIVNGRQIESRSRLLNILTIFEEDDNLWLGTDSGKIFIAKQNSKIFEELEVVPSNSNIKLSYIDNYGEWWLADNDWVYLDEKFVYEQEIIFLSRWYEVDNTWTSYYQSTYPHIQSKDINAMYRINETLYVATNFGLLIFDLMDEKWKLFNKLNGLEDKITDMVFYNNNLYLATDKGMYLFSTIINKPILNDDYYYLNTYIYDIDIQDDILYIVSNYGFYQISLLNNESIKISDRVFSDVISKNNKIMLLINNSIIEYDNQSLNKVFKLNNIKNIDICGDYIWAHNNKKAIIYNSGNNDMKEYDYYDGITGSIINDIGCDVDWVWFSTNNGLVFYNWSNYHYEN